MEIKKINDRIELNVAGQGCWNDCKVSKWYYNKRSADLCTKQISYTHKKSWWH